MKKVITVDDLNGDEGATEHAIEVDGLRITIDLTDEHHAELMEVLAPYLKAGRRTASNAKRPRKPAAPEPRTEPVPMQRTELAPAIPPKDLRAWWKANVDKVDGLPPFVAYGRVPGPVFDAWVQATHNHVSA